jgi:uncharacterized protein YeaO (DUF488 family)
MEEVRNQKEDEDNRAEPEPGEPTLPPMVDRSSRSRPKSTSSNQPPSNVIEIKDSQGSSGKTLDSQSAGKHISDPALTNERLFEAKAKELAEELQLELNLMPSICGRHISLWRLWKVVVSDGFGGSDEVTGRRLWPRVAKKLNYNEFQHKNAAQDLRACYEEFLADFEEFRSAYREDNPNLTDSQEADTSQLIENQLLQTVAREDLEMDLIDEDEEEEDQDDDLDQPPSSAPRPTSIAKRSFGADRINSNTPPNNKRPRIDKGKGKEVEIPSTPEEVLNGIQAARPPLKPSPLKASTVLYPDLGLQEDDDDGSSNELFVRETHKPSSSRQPQRHLEPETQDFHFGTQEPEQNDNGSWMEISSSPSPSKSPERGPSLEESTQSQNESEDPIAAFIEHWISLSYQTDIVIQALEATTMETPSAPYVMEQLTAGAGIPGDMEGVWTSLDDDALDVGDESEEFRRVLRKHGWWRVVKRRRYLKDQQEVENEDEEI